MKVTVAVLYAISTLMALRSTQIKPKWDSPRLKVQADDLRMTYRVYAVLFFATATLLLLILR